MDYLALLIKRDHLFCSVVFYLIYRHQLISKIILISPQIIYLNWIQNEKIASVFFGFFYG